MSSPTLSLKDRLLSAEEECCSAFTEGGDALSAFNKRWEALVHDVDAAYESTDLDTETITLAHTTALRIATLADTCSQLFTTCDSFTTELVTEIEALVSELYISDQPANQARAVPTEYREDDASGQAEARPSSQRNKRRRASVEPPLEGCAQLKACKRRRTSSSYNANSSQTNVTVTKQCQPPTPSSSLQQPHQLTPPSDLTIAPVLRSQKRRLSDADIPTAPKRAKLFSGPRLHAVSDSFPALHSNQSFGLTDPLISVPLRFDPSAPLDIQPLHVTSPSPLATGTVELANPELAGVTSEDYAWTGDTSSRSQLSGLNEFLQSLLDSCASPISFPAPPVCDRAVSPVASSKSTFPPDSNHLAIDLVDDAFLLSPTPYPATSMLFSEPHSVSSLCRGDSPHNYYPSLLSTSYSHHDDPKLISGVSELNPFPESSCAPTFLPINWDSFLDPLDTLYDTVSNVDSSCSESEDDFSTAPPTPCADNGSSTASNITPNTKDIGQVLAHHVDHAFLHTIASVS